MTPVEVDKNIECNWNLNLPYDDDEIGVQVDDKISDELYIEIGEQVGYPEWSL